MNRFKWTLFGIYLAFWTALAIDPLFPEDWLLENLLVFASVPVIVWLERRYGFSNESAWYIFAFMTLHAIGSHYTYSHVPFFNDIREFAGLERNHFDRVAHLLFGYLMFLPLYEVIARHGAAGRAALPLAFFMMVSFSGSYEVLEWLATEATNSELGIAFLGVQGDMWDTQKDMALAFVGNILGAIRSHYVKNR
jgi:putative membrane protein